MEFLTKKYVQKLEELQAIYPRFFNRGKLLAALPILAEIEYFLFRGSVPVFKMRSFCALF